MVPFAPAKVLPIGKNLTGDGTVGSADRITGCLVNCVSLDDDLRGVLDLSFDGLHLKIVIICGLRRANVQCACLLAQAGASGKGHDAVIGERYGNSVGDGDRSIGGEDGGSAVRESDGAIACWR
ncbi:MAG: hypothetical protein WDN28_33245 [Chthoniobacter sp.]